ESARRSPADPIRASTPQSTKLLIWIQPSVPLLRMLSGWRVMSNGRRVAAWARLTTPHSGNASAAHPSSARVDTPLASVAAGDAVPAAVVVLLPAGVLSAVVTVPVPSLLRMCFHPCSERDWRRIDIAPELFPSDLLPRSPRGPYSCPRRHSSARRSSTVRSRALLASAAARSNS